MIKLLQIAGAALLLALTTTACSSLFAPPDTHGYKAAEVSFGNPVGAGWREPIQALDPASPTPLLEQLLAELARTDPTQRYRGITYDLTTDNRLPDGWLLQTPDVWGQRASRVPFVAPDCPGCDGDFRLPACTRDSDCGSGRCGHLTSFEDGTPGPATRRACLGPSEPLLDAIYQVIVGAEQAVDIAVLAEMPDQRFLATLRNAVTVLARSGRAVTIRILAGQYPTGAVDVDGFLDQLTRDARTVAGSRLAVHVGAMRSCAAPAPCDSFSWNHAKIVAADGRVALAGGHNMWTRDYLLNAPVHDVSMRLEGGAARSAHGFLDRLWAFTCSGQGETRSRAWQSGRTERDDGCLAALALPPPRSGPGTIPVASVARLAAGITPDFADQADVAEALMLGAAQHTLRLSLQDLGFRLGGLAASLWPEALLREIVDLLVVKHGAVFIVLSEPDSESAGDNSYSTGVALEEVARKIRAVARARHPMPEAALDALLCRNLHLAPLRFGDEGAWPDGLKMTNHAKVWIVDDRAFHIGSHNLYPVDLQEYGFIVEAREPTRQLLTDYWDPLWHQSSAAAISGDDAFRCILHEPSGR